MIHSAYAYQIDQNLTIENKTNLSLYFSFEPSQSGSGKYIRPHEKIEIPFNNNGWGSGVLYKPYTVPFVIKDASTGIEYIRGRVAFYIHSAAWEKYSFLDSVSTGKGVNLDQTYSCMKGGVYYVFQNKLIIEGNPEGAAPVQAYTDKIKCDGLQSSSHRDNYYDVTCHDKSSTTFAVDTASSKMLGCWFSDFDHDYCFAIIWNNGDGNGGYYTPINDQSLTSLNNHIGHKYCASWEK